MIERLYEWEAVTRAGRVYPSGLLMNNNRGSYDALPHAEIGSFILYVNIHVPRDDDPLVLDLRRHQLLTMHVESDERLIYRRRLSVRTVFGSMVELAKGQNVILVGARKMVRGQSVQRLAWVFEITGEVWFTSRFRERSEWEYSPTLRPYEVAA